MFIVNMFLCFCVKLIFCIHGNLATDERFVRLKCLHISNWNTIWHQVRDRVKLQETPRWITLSYHSSAPQGYFFVLTWHTTELHLSCGRKIRFGIFENCNFMLQSISNRSCNKYKTFYVLKNLLHRNWKCDERETQRKFVSITSVVLNLISVQKCDS